ncbi:hypothetical protein J6590_056964 [Homalodisca vitripennis]|nr:hypothetical protein J6590_056964 [Homalodisca vitripennis]
MNCVAIIGGGCVPQDLEARDWTQNLEIRFKNKLWSHGAGTFHGRSAECRGPPEVGIPAHTDAMRVDAERRECHILGVHSRHTPTRLSLSWAADLIHRTSVFQGPRSATRLPLCRARCAAAALLAGFLSTCSPPVLYTHFHLFTGFRIIPGRKTSWTTDAAAAVSPRHVPCRRSAPGETARVRHISVQQKLAILEGNIQE